MKKHFFKVRELSYGQQTWDTSLPTLEIPLNKQQRDIVLARIVRNGGIKKGGAFDGVDKKAWNFGRWGCQNLAPNPPASHLRYKNGKPRPAPKCQLPLGFVNENLTCLPCRNRWNWLRQSLEESFWNSGTNLEKCRMARLVLLNKVEEIPSPGDTRPITVAGHRWRILEQTLKQKLDDFLENPNNLVGQYGFRAGCSTEVAQRAFQRDVTTIRD